ncbi:MAG: SLBB domain-containing protein [Candidatus Marinimicrobia bacterium]|nr:SLBB domain-containing protein [Candidatus Neomarinimicrobiota bacterium]
MLKFGFKILFVAGVMGLQLGAQSLQDLERLRRELDLGDLTPKQTPKIDEDIASEAARMAVLEQAEHPPSKAGYFGYNFFSDRARVELWENLPAPAKYMLGPGDEIVISLWGDTRLRTTKSISRNGTIFIGEVGLLSLTGKTISEAQSYLKSKFTQVYETLRGSKPTTFMDVSLGRLKLINVTFLGEVKNPGIHAVHPFSRGITGLIQAGGVATSGSLRAIQIIRDNKIAATIDLYSYLLSGSTESDIQLQDQDIIFVPVRHSTISVIGKVKRPFIYESLQGESIADMLSYCGGRTPDASNTIEITRIVDNLERDNDDDVLRIIYIQLSGAKNTLVKNGDIINVREILPADKEVYIYGRVKKPGTYGFQASMKLMDLLELAGGINDESYWKSVYTERGELIRRDENSDYSITITIDLNALRAGDESQNLELENLDQIIIRSNPYFAPSRNVTVQGEVKVPGVYAIRRDGETLEEIFGRVGGFKPSAFQEGIRMQRDGIRVILSDYGIRVAGGDSIFVPFHPGVVRVIGEVYTPGLIHYNPDLKLLDYIESAGGFTLAAAKNQLSVTYANGNVKRKRRFYSPKIEEGAIIEVHQRDETEPFNSTEFASSISSIIASTATLIILFTTALK